MMTDAGRQALAQVHFNAIFREIRRMVRYERGPLLTNTPAPGADVVYLWCYDAEKEPVPVRAIVLSNKGGKTQIRANFVSGHIVLWVTPDCLRMPKLRRRAA